MIRLPCTKTSFTGFTFPPKTNRSCKSIADTPHIEAACSSSTSRSSSCAPWPLDWRPPATARITRLSPLLGSSRVAAMLRSRETSRCPYSSQRNSSTGDTETLESDPMPIRPPCAMKSRSGNTPSPRLASVVGHSATTALLAAMPDNSDACTCVACTSVHASSTAALASSHSTGRAPRAAMHSSTSAVCSEIWMWIGRSAPSCGAASTSRIASAGTARRLCKAIPTRNIGSSCAVRVSSSDR